MSMKGQRTQYKGRRK